MTTKKEYKKNLENGIITEEMLELVLCSLDERAKRYKNKREQYNEQKKFLLTTLLKPTCVEKTVETKLVVEKIFLNSEEECEKYKKNPKFYNVICFSPIQVGEKTVIPADIILKEETEKYFLCYKTKNCVFYLPIENSDRYSNLPIRTVDRLKINDQKELVSAQFCKKLIELAKSGNYQHIPADE
jgi:hypothetical protein